MSKWNLAQHVSPLVIAILVAVSSLAISETDTEKNQSTTVTKARANSGSYVDLKRKNTVTQDYPRQALQEGLEGYVVVKFVVSKKGKVFDLVVVESTHSVFEEASLEAARKLRYLPPKLNGKTVEVEHYYKFSFEIANAEPDSNWGRWMAHP